METFLFFFLKPITHKICLRIINLKALPIIKKCYIILWLRIPAQEVLPDRPLIDNQISTSERLLIYFKNCKNVSISDNKHSHHELNCEFSDL